MGIKIKHNPGILFRIMTNITPATTASPNAATVALLSAKPTKPSPTSLGMAKHPLPTEAFLLFGKKILFAYPISHLCLLGFTFMYLNVNTLFRFSIYSSLMTGNILDATLALKDAEYKVVLFKVTVILCHSIGGASMNCYLMEYFKSRENAFGMIMLSLFLACVVVDIMSMNEQTDNNYVVCLLTIVCGALAHWSSKLGYVVMLHTGNMFKLAEAFWLLINGYSVGGAKLRGDAVMLICLILSSLFGAVAASIALVYLPLASLIPVLITIPMHLHLSGTTAMWGYPFWSMTDYLFNRHLRRASAAPAVDDPSGPPSARSSRIGGTNTPLRGTMADQRDTTGTLDEDELGGRSARNTGMVTPRRSMFSIFERVEITAEDLAEFEAVLAGNDHRAQVNVVM